VNFRYTYPVSDPIVTEAKSVGVFLLTSVQERMSPTVWFVQAGSRGGAASFAGGQGISYSTSIAGKASENRVYRTLVTQDSNSVWSVHCLQLPFQER